MDSISENNMHEMIYRVQEKIDYMIDDLEEQLEYADELDIDTEEMAEIREQIGALIEIEAHISKLW